MLTGDPGQFLNNVPFHRNTARNDGYQPMVNLYWCGWNNVLGGHHLFSRGGSDIGMDQNIFFIIIQLMVIFSSCMLNKLFLQPLLEGLS